MHAVGVHSSRRARQFFRHVSVQADVFTASSESEGLREALEIRKNSEGHRCPAVITVRVTDAPQL